MVASDETGVRSEGLNGCSAQAGHGVRHQTCLAQLVRDVAYGLEVSEEDLSFRLNLWLDRVFAPA